jgi:EAL domain-containing protein (putative c-di-GMP-specific phosphodiesterase class I)
LLRAMIGLCHDLAIGTIAEMVEDERTSQFLASCGVSLGQGYHYAPPTTDVESIIRTYQNRPLPMPGKQSLPQKEKLKLVWTDNIGPQV